MDLSYTNGVRVGALTIDPSGRTRAAFWTHRPARRPAARHLMAAAPLAATWPGALAVPFGDAIIAVGLRLELLPTGYGPGGAALLLSDNGRRTLVVGPTTPALEPRHADRLVLAAPATPSEPAGWVDAVAAGDVTRLLVPDAAAAEAVSARLHERELEHRRPGWLPPTSPHGVPIATSGAGLFVDARPQAGEPWLVAFACQVGPDLVWVHGPRAEALAAQLAAAGLSSRVLQAPRQLAFPGVTLSPTPLLHGPAAD